MTEEREPLLVSSDRAGRPWSSRRRTVRSDSPLSEDLQFGRRASRMKHFVKNTCANCWTVENVKNKFPITKWLPRYR